MCGALVDSGSNSMRVEQVDPRVLKASMCVEMVEWGCGETLCCMWLSGVKSSLGREGSVAQVLVME
jgi:hypothetical protein